MSVKLLARIALIVTAFVVFCVASPVFAKKPAKQPVSKSMAVKSRASARKPVIPLGMSFCSSDLGRIVVGNQAGVLKIYASDHHGVVFTKDAPNTDMTGVDGTIWAPLADKHRQAIFQAVNIRDQEVGDVSKALIVHYRALPALTAVAMLGVIGSIPDEHQLSFTTAGEIRHFLASLLKTEKDVSVRRQAVLALALCAEVDEPAVQDVIAFMTQSHNAWETFTTRQFFEYHKDQIRNLPTVPQLRREVLTSGNPYAMEIANLLD